MDNPVVKLSDPILIPMRRVIPSFKRYDTSSLLMVYGILVLKLLIFKFLPLGLVRAFGEAVYAAQLSLPKLFAVAAIDLVNLMFNIFIFALIIQAILSWIPAAHGNPVQGLLHSITQPVLKPIRRLVPPVSGLDLSVFFTIIALFALQIFVIGSLKQLLLAF